MIPAPAAPRAHSAARNHTSSALPQAYCSIPQRLLTDLRDTPIAIGLYALTARLFLVAKVPVPLSRADVMRYDPLLKAGAVKRAFDRLIDRGWLIAEPHAGHQKQRYTPAWGHVAGAARPWRMDSPCLGRPRHIQRLMLDRGLLDICMGKFTPHATQAGTVTRYVTTPVLSLADVGSYALALADIPCETVALRRLGLIRNGQALPLPTEPRLLAIISQRALDLGDQPGPLDAALTSSGTRRLGVSPAPLPADRAQPLFFVPPSLIGNLIGSLIGSQIGAAGESIAQPTAAQSLEMPDPEHPKGITWESRDQAKQATPPPTPSAFLSSGGGKAENADQEKPRRRDRRKVAEPPVIPATESAQLLQSINVLPDQIMELASIPIETIQAAIADGKARPGIRDLAGWVVTLLRTHRDHGWKITPPAPSAESPEALRLAFARYAAEQVGADLCIRPAQREGMPDDQPWFPPPDPEPLHTSGAPIRLWNQVQSALKTQITRNEFTTWIRRATLISLEQGVATIMVPTALAREVIENRYGPMLRDLLRMYTGEPLELRVILNPSAPAQPAAETATLAAAPSAESPPQPPTPNPQPSSWIAPERWAALPVMLRAALAGAELVDGEVQGRTPYLSTLLRGRYGREVGELLPKSTDLSVYVQ